MSEKGFKCKTYECEKCNFVTTYSSSYKRHIENGTHRARIITKPRKKQEVKEKVPQIFKCDKCEYTANRKENTENHYLKNHASEQERKKRFKYYCDLCNFGTKSNSDNAKHINSIHHKRRAGQNNNPIIKS